MKQQHQRLVALEASRAESPEQILRTPLVFLSLGCKWRSVARDTLQLRTRSLHEERRWVPRLPAQPNAVKSSTWAGCTQGPTCPPPATLPRCGEPKRGEHKRLAVHFPRRCRRPISPGYRPRRRSAQAEIRCPGLRLQFRIDGGRTRGERACWSPLPTPA
jgi:hypothetical protein